MTNASSIHLQYTLLQANQSEFSNFSPIGFSGCDLYRLDTVSSTWRWVASDFVGLEAAGGTNPHVQDSPLWADGPGWPQPAMPSFTTLNASFQYRLHLPSYNGVLDMQIGVPTGAYIAPDNSFRQLDRHGAVAAYIAGQYGQATVDKLATSAAGDAPSIAYIGTSITQGGLTARPGQTYVNRLRRWLGIPMLNLGFCGACMLEPGLAKWMSALDTTPLAYVVDCGWNADAATLHANLVAFVTTLKTAHPTVPVVLVEPSDWRPSWLLGDVQNVTGRRLEYAAAFATLQANGMQGLTLVNGSSLFAGAVEDPTYEGVHPLDNGHSLIAHVLQPILTPIAGDALIHHAQQPSTRAPAPLRQDAPIPAAPAMPQHLSSGIPLSYTAAETAAPGCSDNITWVDAPTLSMGGRAFNTTPTPYNRLPAAAQPTVRQAVWDLSLNSAGITVAFSTNSPTIYVDYTAAGVFEPMTHFPVSGISGMELFAWNADANAWRFVAPSQLPYGMNKWCAAIVTGLPTTTTQYLLYMPPYNNPVSLLVGVVPGSNIAAGNPYPVGPGTQGPIVWYGTSILQGGVTTKAANIFTNVISRALSREIFNFGFSGNGQMEIDVAQWLTQIPQPSAIIVDCLWNLNAAETANRTVPLVQYFRQQHPTTPVILAEGIPFGRSWSNPDDAASEAANNAALYAAYQQLVAAGDSNLHYVKRDSLFSPEGLLDAPEANGLHPSDKGMRDVSAFWIPYLQQLLQ